MIEEVWPSVADPWLEAGTEKVLLPSGTAVLWEPTTVAQLMVRGALPGYLRAMALQFGGDGVDVEKLPDDDKGKWRDLVALFIVEAVRALAMPGAAEFTSYRLTPEQVDPDNPRMPRADAEALHHLAVHLRTVAEVNATSRLAVMEREIRKAVEGGASDETIRTMQEQQREAANYYSRILQREAVSGIAGWLSFRGNDRGADSGANGGALAAAAVRPADHLGPGGRARARRRPVDPDRTRRSRGRKSSEG